MNLRAGWPAAGWTAPRRPVSEAIAEAPPARGWRRLRTHMRSQYDGEASCKLRSAAMPDGRRPEPGGWNRIHFVVEDIASEVQRLKGTDVNFRNEIVTGPGSQQIRLEGRLRKPNRALPANGTTPAILWRDRTDTRSRAHHHDRQ
jgi:hypothetical protein